MIRFALRTLLVAASLLGGAVANASAATLDAIEYYNAPLDHYFVTALPDEIAKLDTGGFVGWKRTGQHFAVFDPATPVAGASPVCRFYGSPAAGLDSHFYSASPAECAAVRQRFPGVWLEETDNAFGIGLPDAVTGQCPPASVPVYRAWNNRVDSNHRFTTDPSTLQAMIAQGYVAEGYGPSPMPVAMCSPTGESAGAAGVPSCIVSASNATPYIGGSIVLTASCTNAPVAFTWTHCASAGAQCNATSTSVGSVTYTVVARNAAGASAPAGVDVFWQSLPPPPKCALVETSQTNPPTINGFVVLRINCNTVVGSFSWNGCTSTGNVCTVRESAAGSHTYSAIARNAGGASAPATLTLNWAASAPVPPGLCGQFPDYLWSDVGSQSVRVESASMPAPAFVWNGAWAVRFVVPATIGLTRIGRMSSAEFAGNPTVREATISRTPCDFRATDPSGANGPVARMSGISTAIQFTPDPSRPGFPVLAPGGVYYYNLRNFQPLDNTISCPASPGRCDAYVDSALPTN
jgi:hypothetical protein